MPVRLSLIRSVRTGSEEKIRSRSATVATVITLSSNSKLKSPGQQHRIRRRHTSGMAVSFGIERRGSGRTSPRRSLGSALVDRMASFRSTQSAPVPVPSASEEDINESRSCFSERFPGFTFFPLFFRCSLYSNSLISSSTERNAEARKERDTI